MTEALYVAEARVTGGRENGRGRTMDGALDVDIRLPKEFGGTGLGTNPEQLFAVGYAACFEASLSLVAQRPKLDVHDSTIDARVMLIPVEGGLLRLAVELNITLPSVPDDQVVRLVAQAHAVCPYSNATRGNIAVTLVVNGVRQ